MACSGTDLYICVMCVLCFHCLLIKSFCGSCCCMCWVFIFIVIAHIHLGPYWFEIKCYPLHWDALSGDMCSRASANYSDIVLTVAKWRLQLRDLLQVLMRFLYSGNVISVCPHVSSSKPQNGVRFNLVLGVYIESCLLSVILTCTIHLYFPLYVLIYWKILQCCAHLMKRK